MFGFVGIAAITIEKTAIFFTEINGLALFLILITYKIRDAIYNTETHGIGKMKKLILIFLFLVPLFANATTACNGRWVEHKNWSLTGAHAKEKCACTHCHQGALVAETAPTTCVGCHQNAKLVTTKLPKVHLPTGAIDCGYCHTVHSFLGTKTDHSAFAKQTCDSCHNQTFQLEAPFQHVKTKLDCAVCHQAESWAAKFDHDKAKVKPATCNNCHLFGKNGATLKPSGHIITFESCDTCHSR